MEHPARLSARKKAELVLRLLRGRGVNTVSRESRVSPEDLTAWMRVFVAHGTRALESGSEAGGLDVILAPDEVKGPSQGAEQAHRGEPTDTSRCRILLLGSNYPLLGSLKLLLGTRCSTPLYPSITKGIEDAAWHPDVLAWVVCGRSGDAGLLWSSDLLRRRLPEAAILLVIDAAAASDWSGTSRFDAVLPDTISLKEALDHLEALTRSRMRDRVTPTLSRHVFQALEQVRQSYARPVTVSTLAYSIGLSASYLAHVFSNEVGLSLKDYVTRVRIEIAKCLLADSSNKLHRVARLVGFTDASHLSRIFRRREQRRPGEFRIA